MFGVTFLGHQGWIVRSGSSCLLVDPLLVESFGEIHALEYDVYPPRILAPSAFPAVDAVMLSHEHDDHFDIPSLARLDRRIPIFLSAHSSSAAYRILREMGFVVQPLIPGVPIAIGELIVIPLSGDHLSVNCADEWDALPFLITDRARAGSLFSMVDVMLLPHHVEWAKRYLKEPGLVTWSNNALDWSHMGELPAQDVGTEECVRGMEAGHKLVTSAWGKPQATLMCAGGFSFTGTRAWFNRRVFWVDTEVACRQLAELHPAERFYSTLPGQTFWMEGNQLVQVDESTPFIRTAARDRWPVRGRAVTQDVPDYAPATRRRELSGNDRVRLRERLDTLANALVGGILFRSLHSLLAVETPGKKPTFAFVLRHGAHGATETYEYNASACAFFPVQTLNPVTAYAAGWECWATDLLAVLDGEIGPITLMFGRARIWNSLPPRLSFDLLEGLTRVSHPLSCPSEYLRNYERMWELNKAVIPTIKASSAASVPAHVK